MARLKCKCGNTLSNSNEPEIQYSIISDEKMIELLRKLDEGALFINIYTNYYLESWKCPVCERLYIFKEGKDHPARIYKIEESDGETI